MKRMLSALVACAVLGCSASGASASEEARSLTQQERDFYVSSIVPAMTLIRIALPPAPEGWVRESETPIDRDVVSLSAGDIANFRFSYAATYRRTAGVQEETAKLEAAAGEITKRLGAAADAELADLRKKKADAEKALKQAQQRKEIGRERKLKKQLDDLRKSVEAVPRERDRKIAEETDPLIVRDRVVVFRVLVNESAADHPDLSSFTRPKAAFALRRDSEREGATGWKEGRTVILYGDWQEVKNNSFRLRMEQRPFSARAQSVTIAVTGDRTRTDQFLKKTDIRSLLELMK